MIRWYKRLLPGLLIGLIGAGILMMPVGQKLEEKFGLYWLFHLRGAIPAPDQVAIIAIDQPSAVQLDLPLLPRLWPREMHARLIERLTAAGARLIVFDLIFDSPSPVPRQDEKLSRAMRLAGNTVLIERLTYHNAELALDDRQAPAVVRQEGTTRLLPEIIEAALASAPFPLPKAERVNDYWTFKSSAGDLPTVPVIVLQLFALPLHDEFARLLALADPLAAARLPAITAERDAVEDLVFFLRELFANNSRLAANLQARLYHDSVLNKTQKQLLAALIAVYSDDEKHYLNFYGPPRTVKTIPYFEALRLLGETDALSAIVKDRVVFVGFSGATQPEQDVVRDDYHTVFSNPDGLYISGVEIAATATANLLENKPLVPFSHQDGLIVIVLLGLMLGTVFQHISTRQAVVSGIVVTVCYTFIAYVLFKQDAIWIPTVIPLTQLVLAFVVAEALKHYRAEQKTRMLEVQLTEIKKFLSSAYPNPAIEAVLGKDRDELEIHGLCLMTDVEGFTTLSEPMDPGILGHLMTQYRDVLKNPIKQHHGYIMDMTGDSMLAVWIADPGNSTARAYACSAALNLAEAVEYFNRSQPEGKPRLPTRIGLNFGEMALYREDGHYSVTGDVVNTAHRIQGVNKMLKTRILLSNDAITGLDGFLMRPLGDFLLLGRIKPVRLLELVAQRQIANHTQFWLCDSFAHALDAYHARQWQLAGHRFAEILQECPHDGPSQFYLSLCQQYEKEPVPGIWPTYRISSK
ncbi:MAG: adenylate/guanylate cyclase domain-containing protein [Nitrosomonas sp.]|nr:MAG: adenylate/guanylate cyclase domain-containing protein [Nitrosomonas sp.]